MEKKEIQNIIEIALFAGEIMLENGAETSRVEDTINRICTSRNINIESFTIPTGIFLSYKFMDEFFSYVIRTKTSGIDLERIVLVNDFSRNFVNSSMNLEDAKNRLEEIKKVPKFNYWIISFFGGIAGGFFTLSFGGRLIEAILSFITSFFVVSSVNYLRKYVGGFFRNIVGGIINTVIALTLIYLLKPIDNNIELSKIVIGSLMPLVPGVAITNALRDSISGDFVSGVSKLSEAILLAIAIAIGVGVVFHIKILITGNI